MINKCHTWSDQNNCFELRWSTSAAHYLIRTSALNWNDLQVPFSESWFRFFWSWHRHRRPRPNLKYRLSKVVVSSFSFSKALEGQVAEIGKIDQALPVGGKDGPGMMTVMMVMVMIRRRRRSFYTSMTDLAISLGISTTSCSDGFKPSINKAWRSFMISHWNADWTIWRNLSKPCEDHARKSLPPLTQTQKIWSYIIIWCLSLA